jgi:hypothetical protein
MRILPMRARKRVLPSRRSMSLNSTLYHGLFHRHADSDRPRLSRHEAAPAAIPCPKTGRPLRIATIDANTLAICPSCAEHGQGGFVSFVADLRMAYACPECRQLVWVQGV